MSLLLDPLRRRAVWVTGVVVLLVGGAFCFIRFVETGDGAEFAGALFDTAGLAAFLAAAVAFLGNLQPDYRSEVLQGIDPARRRRIHRSVVRGDVIELPAVDRLLGGEYAAAYVESTPRTVSLALLVVSGFLCQRLAYVFEWEGDRFDVANLVFIALVVSAVFIGVRIVLRQLKNAEQIIDQSDASPADDSSPAGDSGAGR